MDSFALRPYELKRLEGMERPIFLFVMSSFNKKKGGGRTQYR